MGGGIIDNYPIIENGNIFFGLSLSLDDYQGSFTVDIFVWEKEDPVRILSLLEELSVSDPNNEGLQHLAR